MRKFEILPRRAVATLSPVIIALASASTAWAAPSVTGVKGTFDHKASITISGSGFGSKEKAAPVVWDDASGEDIRSKWDLTWPNTTSAYNMAYRSPQRGIDLPHKHITRYLAGAHEGSGGANGGANVAVWKNRTISSYPAYSYISWYQRADDAWRFSGDNNYKVFDFSRGDGGYDLPYNWYIEYNDRPSSRTATPRWHLLDDAYGQSSSALGGGPGNWWFGDAVNPMSGKWTKIEVEIKYSTQSDGYIKLWENGKLKIDFKGKTDGYSGTHRSEGIGGFARAEGPDNWRYFADIYLDYTPARVVLGNASTLSQSTIIEPQIPTAWSGSSITATVNLGQFQAGQTAYLFVVDSSGTPSANGYAIKVGGSGGTAVVPEPPSNVRVE